jgi:hypothetical protein
MLQTRFPFTLPIGFVDANGEIHRDGEMRMATAFDEIVPLKDPRVQANDGYLLIVLLARVVTRLGGAEVINPKMIEGLFAADLAFLQDMYRRINSTGSNLVRTDCPNCAQTFNVEIATVGEFGATP